MADSCARCGTEILFIGVGARRRMAVPMTLRDAVDDNPHSPIDCGHCGNELYDGRGHLNVKSGGGKKAPNYDNLKKTYKREREFKASGASYVDFDALTRIEAKSGVSFGKTWSGTFDDLAAHARMSPEDVQKLWPNRPSLGRQPTLTELRAMGAIEVSN